MKGLKVKPSQYDSYIKKKSHALIDALKGEFYEYYCYNELIQNDDNIKIVKANYSERKTRGKLIHTMNGKIIYQSRGLSIAEFDILGIKGDTVYWWEITRSKKREVGFHKKTELLNKLFGNYKKKYCLIIPYKIDNELPYEYKIIPEPDYTIYLNNGYFKFNKKIKDCISLKDFEKKSSDYEYIDDLISVSHDYYDNKNYGAIENFSNCFLIERIYNIKEIKNSKFDYFDIRNRISGYIEISDQKLFMDGMLLKKKSLINKEITVILKRLEYILQ